MTSFSLTMARDRRRKTPATLSAEGSQYRKWMNEQRYKLSLYSTLRMKFPWLSMIYDSSFGQRHSSHGNSICGAWIMWWLPGQLRTVCWNINKRCAQERARTHARMHAHLSCMLTLAKAGSQVLMCSVCFSPACWVFAHFPSLGLLLKGSLVERTFFNISWLLYTELLRLVLIYRWQKRCELSHRDFIAF